MRGIGRVLAGVLLVGAVGGAAAFARQSGNDLSAQAVELAAPPLQHIGAPGTVLFARTPPPTRVTIDIRRPSSQQALRPSRAVQPVPAVPQPTPVPAPSARPAPAQAPAPAPAPLPARALAAVQVAAAQPATAAKGHGRALGHVKQHLHGPPAAVDAPAAPAPVDPGANGGQPAWGHTKSRGTPSAD
jgi:outer membrane biosynthesis protein TonB